MVICRSNLFLPFGKVRMGSNTKACCLFLRSGNIGSTPVICSPLRDCAFHGKDTE